MNYFLEIFKEMEYLAPGSEKSTIAACKMILDANGIKNIVDMGCGNGTQTIALSKYFKTSNIVGIDIDQYQLDKLNLKIRENNLIDRVSCINSSMIHPIVDICADLIWSEGAIYIIGLKNGLNIWKKFLKKEGYLVFSDLSWSKTPSQEAYDYWKKYCPNIDTINNKIKIIEECGYKLINHFSVDKSDWTENFYGPLENRLKHISKEFKSNEESQKILKQLSYEIELYNNHSDEYSYEFYITKKVF